MCCFDSPEDAAHIFQIQFGVSFEFSEQTTKSVYVEGEVSKSSRFNRHVVWPWFTYRTSKSHRMRDMSVMRWVEFYDCTLSQYKLRLQKT